jgi:glyceraldehyde-3-phosphate dehydrogenase/erythrose-4-phosphate dehydrogenase
MVSAGVTRQKEDQILGVGVTIMTMRSVSTVVRGLCPILPGRATTVKSVINATGPLTTNARLLRYDSVHGRFPDHSHRRQKLDLGRG